VKGFTVTIFALVPKAACHEKKLIEKSKIQDFKMRSFVISAQVASGFIQEEKTQLQL
jgi:hypothetical protein